MVILYCFYHYFLWLLDNTLEGIDQRCQTCFEECILRSKFSSEGLLLEFRHVTIANSVGILQRQNRCKVCGGPVVLLAGVRFNSASEAI